MVIKAKIVTLPLGFKEQFPGHLLDLRHLAGLPHEEEIAELKSVHKDSVSGICRKMADLPKSDKSYAGPAIDIVIRRSTTSRSSSASFAKGAAPLKIARCFNENIRSQRRLNRK